MAESFGVDARGYDTARPRYPLELVERLIAGRSGLEVLDVGCGTGIAARQFQAAGCLVLGVEPDVRMAEFARSTGVEVESATLETWDSRDRSFDLVIAAQSWHWVDPVLGSQKAASVLRPGGRLAIFGHVFEPPGEIATAFADAYRRVVPDSPFHGSGRRALDVYLAGYQKIATSLEQDEEFTDVQQWRFDWTQPYTCDEWLKLLPTTGGLTQLTPSEQQEILDAVGDAIRARGGAFTMDYVTLAVVTGRV